MKLKYNKVFNVLLFMGLILFALTSCDTAGEEEMTFKPGNHLFIMGSDALEVGATDQYYVDNNTIKKTYTWTISGAGATVQVDPDNPDNSGFVNITFPTEGTYEVSVSDGTYEGKMTVVVSAPA